MSYHSGKILELLSIENISAKHYLFIKLIFGQEIKLRWEIEVFTADSLKNILKNSKKYKLRLSQHCFWDAKTNQYYGYLTKTYRDKSEKISFQCSKEFAETLNLLKDIHHINELNNHSSISIILNDTNKPKYESNVKTPFKQKKWKATITIFSIVATLFIIYSSYLYMNKTVFAEKKIATNLNVKSVVIESEVNQLEETTKELTTVPIKKRTDDELVSPIPFINLDSEISYHLPDNYVALTFDDGPSKYSKQIVDILKKHQVGGTFFFIGKNVLKYPDYVKYVNVNGFSIGNHSLNHLDLSKLSIHEQEFEITKTNKLIEDIISEPIHLFRPPYGAKNESTIAIMSKYNQKMILWNRDTEDWRRKNAKDILEYVYKSPLSGSIILLHESQAVVDALPDIIKYLQAKNLQIVSLK